MKRSTFGRRLRVVVPSVLGSLLLAGAARGGPASDSDVHAFCNAQRAAHSVFGTTSLFDMERCLCEANYTLASGKDRRTSEQATKLCSSRTGEVDCAKLKSAFDRTEPGFQKARTAWEADQRSRKKLCAYVAASKAWLAAARPFTRHCTPAEKRAEFDGMLDGMQRAISAANCE